MTEAQRYKKAGYHVAEHGREHNGLAGDDGYYVYYVSHLYEAPFFLAEWRRHHATGGTREDAVDTLQVAIIVANDQK